ncbi:ornithine cyclodeaminase family protein, partial [Serratia marcescens]|uniref:ornithine cyclodeaminase family protein n=1 Tax=Serratia marcescens TaxID=615 RepID=UPI0011E619BC
MHILNRQQILAAFDAETITPLLKQGFIAYSQQRVQQPPVQHFLFEQAAGDCCIKSAWLEGDELFVVKVSAGFYRNAERGLASNQGLVMAFSAQTGEPRALLQDEGWLTALRTALAGRIVAELCAPPHIQAIGMVGTGLQARLQLQCLKPVTDCREVWVWGRNEQALAAYRRDAEAEGFRVRVTQNAAELAAHCQLIVTTTPSREPILQAADIRPGTHITAVGADAPGKQELATDLVARADA